MLQRILSCLFLLIGFGLGESYAQQPKPKRIITGTVSDETGPLAGASVIIKNNPTKGVSTDLDGHYSIEVQGTKDVLKFSYIGYKDKEITVGKQGIIDVKLTSENDNNIICAAR